MNPTDFARLAVCCLVLSLSACANKPPILPDPGFGPVEPLARAPAGEQTDGAIYSAAAGVSLFEDRTALRVGDILTIVLSESTAASKSASTATQKNDSLEIGAPTLFGGDVTYNGRAFLQNSSDAERSFAGSGDSSQSNSLTGEITVTVSRVLSNGNLAIQGEKIIGINQGAEFVRLRGLVRPQDVSPNNTVLSSKIANAEIYYGGDGAVAEANAKGWLARFFSSDYWPF